MKKLLTIISFLMISGISGTAAQTRSWEGIHRTPLTQAEAEFQTPPVEFASHVIWGWEGEMDKKTIQNDLDSMRSKGFRAVIFEAGYRLPFEYLSEGWFKAIRNGVLEAKKRGMKVWIIDEGKYPSGFAGGKFTKERPDLRMQALVVCDTVPVERAEVITDREVPAEVISAVAVSRSGAPNRTVEIADGKFSFHAGLDAWDILLVRSDFRTAVTRAVNNPSGGKDASNSLGDYLNPVAIRQFIDWTHEQYKKYLGAELGTTVLGFRGDEPDYAHTPWTPRIIEEFVRIKGYDPTPYLASFFTRTLSTEEQRVKADYWDVWSQLFATHFFKQQADWCEENGVAHITHLNNEHNMPVCVRAEGDFFRNLSKVQVPGVDAIWNQIWPGTVNDFPKLAGSVAHVYGKPRAFSESFAAYYTSPTIPQAKFVVDHQMVRGINFFEFMFWPSGSKSASSWMRDPGMKGLNEYTNRATYLLAQGEPGARIAMYYPTSSIWLGNQTVFNDLTLLTQELLKQQRDFDYVNDDAFTEALTVGPGYLANRSGQRYNTLIIPSADVISLSAWNKIEEFAARGGKVLFWGRKPTMLADKTFTRPLAVPDMPAAYYEPSLSWSATVSAAMPAAEMAILKPRPQQPARRPQQGQPQEKPEAPATDFIRYTRRVMPDGDLYFLFNEGDKECTFTADFDKVGIVREWNASTGEITPLKAEVEADKSRLTMTLAPWESKIITIERSTAEYDIKAMGVKGDGTVETAAIQRVIDHAYRNGGGTVVMPAGNYLSGALFFPRGVNLRMEKDALLTSTVNRADFPVITTRFEGIERKWCCAFLNFDNSEGVRVSGEGTIDGKGVEWGKLPFGGTGRPRMLCFTNCPGGEISGLKMINQASWCLHVLYTDGFKIDGVDIRALEYIPSSDGIDIDSSSDVLITGVRIEAHDDCISIKSGRDTDGRRVARPSENILIEKCHFAYGHGGVAMGSEISGSIRNVTIRNCVMDNENWSPLRFKSQPSRGGVVENITFEDIDISGARSIFDINMEWRMVPPLYPAADPLTRLRNIRFRNIRGEAKSVGTMYGFKDAPFGPDSFHFENCNIKAERGLSIANVEGVNFEGLNLEVSAGEKIFERPEVVGERAEGRRNGQPRAPQGPGPDPTREVKHTLDKK